MLRTASMMFLYSDMIEFRLKGQNCKLDAAIIPDEVDKICDLEWID